MYVYSLSDIISAIFVVTLLVSVIAFIVLTPYIAYLNRGRLKEFFRKQFNNALTDKIVFRNLVLYSGHNTKYTEIDMVIVSPYGIFCVEFKNHAGVIIGDKKRKYWMQYKYKSSSRFYNPLHQNYKHIKALEITLHNNLKAPVHSAVVFLNTDKVRVDHEDVFIGLRSLETSLKRHHRRIYTHEEYRRICRTLAYAEQISKDRLPRHIDELQQYLAKAGV